MLNKITYLHINTSSLHELIEHEKPDICMLLSIKDTPYKKLH